MWPLSLSLLIASSTLTMDLPKVNSEKVYPASNILEGVPKVGYGVHLCSFPACLSSCLEYMGDPSSYDYLMAVSGGAFRRLWQRDDGGNVDLMYFSPEPYAKAFSSLGYDYETVSHEKKEMMVKAIKRSINAHRPALVFGIIGPPECGIITGYEDNGETLRGYSYFQDASIEGYYRQTDWYEKAEWVWKDSLILIGEKKQDRPSNREVLISTLKWAIHLSRMPEWKKHVNGLAAYEAWAKGLEVDADYPRGATEIIQTRCMIYGDQCVMTEDRRSAGVYLREMAGVVKEASGELNAAADDYTAVADTGTKLWPWQSMDYYGADVREGLLDTNTRMELAAVIRQARQIEENAVTHLEKALAILEKQDN